MDLPPHNQGLS
jgi:hypothetical protein